MFIRPHSPTVVMVVPELDELINACEGRVEGGGGGRELGLPDLVLEDTHQHTGGTIASECGSPRGIPL
jgi:hypothetical protein